MFKLLTHSRSFAIFVIAIFFGTAILMADHHDQKVQAANEPGIASNPLVEKWAGPYGGIPPFDKVKVADFKPALETAMSEDLAEIDRIAADKSVPNFENTIAAMERTGRALDRVTTVYGIWSSNMSTPEFRAVEAEM